MKKQVDEELINIIDGTETDAELEALAEIVLADEKYPHEIPVYVHVDGFVGTDSYPMDDATFKFFEKVLKILEANESEIMSGSFEIHEGKVLREGEARGVFYVELRSKEDEPALFAAMEKVAAEDPDNISVDLGEDMKELSITLPYADESEEE